MDTDSIIQISLLFTMIGIVAFLLFSIGKSCRTCEDIITASERFELYNISFNNTWDGFYSGQKYYCVWTKDMTPEQIANIEEHEKCHALVDIQREHFCE